MSLLKDGDFLSKSRSGSISVGCSTISKHWGVLGLELRGVIESDTYVPGFWSVNGLIEMIWTLIFADVCFTSIGHWK